MPNLVFFQWEKYPCKAFNECSLTFLVSISSVLIGSRSLSYFVSVVFNDSPWQTESLSLQTWLIFIPGNYICLVSKVFNRTLIRWLKLKAAVGNHSSMTKNTLCHHFRKLISSISQSQRSKTLSPVTINKANQMTHIPQKPLIISKDFGFY